MNALKQIKQMAPAEPIAPVWQHQTLPWQLRLTVREWRERGGK